MSAAYQLEPTVYIIEDDTDLRESVVSLVSSKGYRCESFDSAEMFLNKSSPTQQPGCILLDFQLKGCDGLAFLKQHRESSYMTPVVVVTAHADVRLTVEFMKAGASTLLKKPYEIVELLNSIDIALEWDRNQFVARQQKERVQNCFRKLSKRQEDILAFVLNGAMNKAIAAELDVSERTVESERAEILRTFGVKNVVELAVLITEFRASSDR